jgi:hypothetical protein
MVALQSYCTEVALGATGFEPVSTRLLPTHFSHPSNHLAVILRASVRDADAVSEVASGRLAVGSALMLAHLFGAERVSPAARDRIQAGN